jgi:hypothetical protein
MKILPILCLIGIAITFFSCGQSQNHTFTIENVELSSEGPLFQGINTATGMYEVDLEEFLNSIGAQISDIRQAKLLSAELIIMDSMNFNIIGDVSLLLAGENTEMKSLAVLNPIPDDVTKIQLQIAEEQSKIANYFKEENLTFVVDLDLLQDTMVDLRMLGNFIFELQTKN